MRRIDSPQYLARSAQCNCRVASLRPIVRWSDAYVHGVNEKATDQGRQQISESSLNDLAAKSRCYTKRLLGMFAVSEIDVMRREEEYC